ncbi:MAG: hypothetical protein EOO20_24575 [Chryseobacterium sp.]|nr:MAG: hypothetical protein EOO20_24575 [Chryseobacterium sp.]
MAIPTSRIANFISFELAGIISDIPQQQMALKAFHCMIQNDFDAVNREEAAYQPIPVVREVNESIIMKNYITIKEEVEQIALTEMRKLV